MSLYDMDTDTTDALPTVQLGNAVSNYVIAGLQAIDWEPDGFVQGVQTMRKGKRRVGIVVVVMEGSEIPTPVRGHPFGADDSGISCTVCGLPEPNARHF